LDSSGELSVTVRFYAIKDPPICSTPLDPKNPETKVFYSVVEASPI